MFWTGGLHVRRNAPLLETGRRMWDRPALRSSSHRLGDRQMPSKAKVIAVRGAIERELDHRCGNAKPAGLSRRHGNRAELLKQSEPMTGIEPAYSAWEADVLPLNYIGEGD